MQCSATTFNGMGGERLTRIRSVGRYIIGAKPQRVPEIIHADVLFTDWDDMCQALKDATAFFDLIALLEHPAHLIGGSPFSF